MRKEGPAGVVQGGMGSCSHVRGQGHMHGVRCTCAGSGHMVQHGVVGRHIPGVRITLLLTLILPGWSCVLALLTLVCLPVQVAPPCSPFCACPGCMPHRSLTLTCLSGSRCLTLSSAGSGREGCHLPGSWAPGLCDAFGLNGLYSHGPFARTWKQGKRGGGIPWTLLACP
jgi:hypothetical protein